MAARSFALVGSRDAWLRCAHDGTHVDAAGAVGLAWTEPEGAEAAPAATEPGPGGLAFDPQCRLYRSLPDEGRVVRSRWDDTGGLPGKAPPPEPMDLFAAPSAAPGGDFRPDAPASRPLDDPRGVAVTSDERLFVAETGALRVVVHDLWSRTLLRVVPTVAAPVDVAAEGDRVLALLAGGAGVLEVSARELMRPVPVERAPGGDAPDPPGDARRLAVAPDGRVAVLDGEDAGARVVLLERDRDPTTDAPRLRAVAEVAAPGGRALAFDGEGALVVARRPGRSFLHWAFHDGDPVERPPLRAPAYDGRGIVRTPAGRVAYGTSRGLRHALPARVRYEPRGAVVTFRLDGGAWRLDWGRLFLDACVPEGTRVRVRCVAADEPPPGPTLVRTPPPLPGGPPDLPGESPPMPPLALLAAPGEAGPVHRRATGREIPWAEAHEDGRWETFEVPVGAGPGRWLWVVLELEGNGRATPRVKSLRVERPGHDLLGRLPAVLSRDPDAASFLRRYLAMVDGSLAAMEGRAAARHVLVRAESAPAEVLPWLAGFVGLVLDERWPVEARRTAVAEAVPLFRARGTVPGLRRFIEIYTGPPVILVEHFRLRGTGGALLGDEGPAFTSSIVGGGLRVGGDVGVAGTHPLEGSVEDAFRTHAHRFSVILPRLLTAEERDVVGRILEVHRPAHTVVDVCTVGAGMRVGRGLHVGMSSIVGRTGGFRPLRVGAGPLGRDAVIGRPGPATRVGSGRVARDTEVG